jgi:hypothetical protein
MFPYDNQPKASPELHHTEKSALPTATIFKRDGDDFSGNFAGDFDLTPPPVDPIDPTFHTDGDDFFRRLRLDASTG